MPLSKAKDRERKKRVGIQPNDVVLHLSPALKDWITERSCPRTPEQYIIDQLEKAAGQASRLESYPREPKVTIDPMCWQV